MNNGDLFQIHKSILGEETDVPGWFNLGWPQHEGKCTLTEGDVFVVLKVRKGDFVMCLTPYGICWIHHEYFQPSQTFPRLRRIG